MQYEIEIFNQYNIEKTKYNLCPKCSHKRNGKNRNQRCLMTDWETALATCQHCGIVLQLHKYKNSYCTLKYSFIESKKANKLGTYHSEKFFNKVYNKYLNQDNYFSKYLLNYFSKNLIKEAEKKLMIFSTSDFYDRSICYPYINEFKKVTGIKIMPYDKNGKRKKGNKGNGIVNWIHRINKIDNWVNSFCLFGLGQIVNNKASVVHIVESEKTAFVMTIVKPEYLWLATGGLRMLNKEKLIPLKTYKIVLHPDKGSAFIVWNNLIKELKCFDIIVSRITEDNPYIPDKGDLADYYLIKNNDLCETTNVRTLSSVIDNNLNNNKTNINESKDYLKTI